MSDREPSQSLTEQVKVSAPMCQSYIYSCHQELMCSASALLSIKKEKKDVRDAGTILDGGNLHNLWISPDVRILLMLIGTVGWSKLCDIHIYQTDLRRIRRLHEQQVNK